MTPAACLASMRPGCVFAYVRIHNSLEEATEREQFGKQCQAVFVVKVRDPSSKRARLARRRLASRFCPTPATAPQARRRSRRSRRPRTCRAGEISTDPFHHASSSPPRAPSPPPRCPHWLCLTSRLVTGRACWRDCELILNMLDPPRVSPPYPPSGIAFHTQCYGLRIWP